jgi:hypothetical protein
MSAKGASKKLDDVIHADDLIGCASKARVRTALSTDSKLLVQKGNQHCGNKGTR